MARKHEALAEVIDELETAKVDYKVDRSRKHIHVTWYNKAGRLMRKVLPASPSDSYFGSRKARADVRRMLRGDGL